MRGRLRCFCEKSRKQRVSVPAPREMICLSGVLSSCADSPSKNESISLFKAVVLVYVPVQISACVLLPGPKDSHLTSIDDGESPAGILPLNKILSVRVIQVSELDSTQPGHGRICIGALYGRIMLCLACCGVLGLAASPPSTSTTASCTPKSE